VVDCRTSGEAWKLKRKRCLSGGGGRRRGLVRRRSGGRGRAGHQGDHVVRGGSCRDGRRRGHGRGGAVSGHGRTIVLGGLVQSGLDDGRNARVGVPERSAAAQHIKTRVPNGRVGRGATRQDGPHAPGRFLTLLCSAGDDGHFFDVVVRIRSLWAHDVSYKVHTPHTLFRGPEI